MPPRHYIPYQLPFPEAGRLADLFSISEDLDASFEILKVWRVCYTEKELRTVEWEALGAALVVRYGRCFATGVRTYLEHSVIETAPEEIQITHEFLINLRNRHVAHSVNRFEEVVVTAVVGSHYTSSEEIVGLGMSAHGHFMFNMKDPERIEALLEWVSDFVKSEIEIEKIKVIEHVRSLPLESIKAHDMHSPSYPESMSELARVPRKRW